MDTGNDKQEEADTLFHGTPSHTQHLNYLSKSYLSCFLRNLWQKCNVREIGEKKKQQKER